jgi:formylglycine-generating enzyme required for sulfatase activity
MRPVATAALREIRGLDELIELPAGRYVLGEPGEEREVRLGRVLIGRYPMVNARLRDRHGKRTDPQLADHPVTDVTLEEAEAFCVGLGARLPTSDEWEALARGTDRRPYPWGEVFDEALCACASADGGWGWTVPVTAHPGGASPFGAEQLAGNVWEWVADRTPDGWGVVRGGSYLDTEWGLRASRVQPADPARATPTTGFRIAIDIDEGRSA